MIYDLKNEFISGGRFSRDEHKELSRWKRRTRV